MAESLVEGDVVTTREFVTLKPPFVPKWKLERLMRWAEKLARKKARVLETAIQDKKYGMFLWESVEPDGEKIYMLWTKNQMKNMLYQWINNLSGRAYRPASSETGLEEKAVVFHPFVQQILENIGAPTGSASEEIDNPPSSPVGLEELA